MATKLTDNQILFSNITIPGKTTQAVISKYEYKNPSGNFIDDEYTGDIQQPSPFINAIDIDWNEAKVQLNGDLSTKTIKTTGELLSQIKETYSPMFAN